MLARQKDSCFRKNGTIPLSDPPKGFAGQGELIREPFIQPNDGLWRPGKERRYSACLSVIAKFNSAGRPGVPKTDSPLIELLIVIIVLGILAAIVIFSLTGVTGQSEAAACNSDAKTVETAVSAYYAENNDTYPAIDRRP